MAPNSRLEEKLRKLGLKSDDNAASRSSPASKSKCCFRVYFPMPPYDGLHFNALRSGSGYNFTGQLLGVGGKQLQRIKQESSARVEVVNAQGNLNGAHPDPLDPGLHALITADSLGKLQKAAEMVWELLQPANARFQPIEATPGGSVRLIVGQQGKPLGTGAGSTTPSPAATPIAPGKLKACSMSKAAEAAGRSASASPALTPMTPAAAANNHTFAASQSSSCSRRSCSPQPRRADDTSSSKFTRSCSSNLSRDSSSIQAALFGSPQDAFALPPATLQSQSGVGRRVSFDSTPGPSDQTASSTSGRQIITGADPAVGRSDAASRSGTSRTAEQQESGMTVGSAHSTCDFQPPTPTAQQTRSGAGLAASVAAPAAPAAGSAVALHFCRPSEHSSTGNVSLPSSLMQDLDIAADETLPRSAQNSNAGVLPA
eukprot:GHUV01009896.1.p1 GENE.GHUV01009896.1~~GHUV01009896.1.p1  ORF type:complete len:429 (+),score=138.47 GHUV01009896.1:439-1725(+)